MLPPLLLFFFGDILFEGGRWHEVYFRNNVKHIRGGHFKALVFA